MNVVIYDRRKKSGDLLLNCFIHRGFSAFLLQEKEDLYRKKMDMLVTEVNDEILFSDLKKDNKKLKILVFSNFSRDPYVENLYDVSIEMALAKSYKINDIIEMTTQITNSNRQDTIIGLNKYFTPGFNQKGSLCGYLKNTFVGTGIEITEQMISSFDQFLDNANLNKLLNDPEMIRIALHELIDNAIQAQRRTQLNEYNVTMEIRCDETKIGISVHNAGNPPDKESLFSSLNRKMKLKHDESSYFSGDQYEDSTYVGKSGRGFYIIQKGVHLLSIMLMENQNVENMESSQKDNANFFEASILLFISRHQNEKIVENRKKPGYYMVLTI